MSDIRRIHKILIANRAEIAVRIARTCAKRSIKTVGIYTHGEETLEHVQAVDKAILLEGSNFSENYLNVELLISLAKQESCDAIHPGYGFLSENAAFAKRVTEEGLLFIGPTAEVIDLMGDKKRARDVAAEAGVPLVPGFSPVGMQNEHEILNKASSLGFPVLIKATAGGGGKGMRIVHDAKDFMQAFTQAAAEAQSAFGHDEVLVEKYLVEPRHIEVQVISDQHNNHYHLFERDCSVQRRHQKVVEESPAFGLSEETRTRLFDTALSLCQKVGYRNAGTIEFIMDKDQSIYFLEMNTRLQVEHPVTELVSGLDLVSLQIDVAEGKKLDLDQSTLVSRGHALELRLYAEDPMHNYLPTSGMLKDFFFPAWPNVRIDTGFQSQNEVTNRFDPMIAKLIFYGSDRDDCLKLAASYLHECRVSGFVTNMPLLKRIVADEAFNTSAATTHFLSDRMDLVKTSNPTTEEQLAAIAASIWYGRTTTESAGVSNGKSAVNRVWQSTTLEDFRNV